MSNESARAEFGIIPTDNKEFDRWPELTGTFSNRSYFFHFFEPTMTIDTDSPSLTTNNDINETDKEPQILVSNVKEVATKRQPSNVDEEAQNIDENSSSDPELHVTLRSHENEYPEFRIAPVAPFDDPEVVVSPKVSPKVDGNEEEGEASVSQIRNSPIKVTSSISILGDSLASTPGENEETVTEEDPELGVSSPFGGERLSPDVFYCPISKKLLEEPVVAPDGISYDRAAIEATNDYPKGKLYPNRALQSLVEETVAMSDDSLLAGLKRMGKSMRDQLQQVLDQSALPSTEFHSLPDAYFCPITFELMHQPVIDAEGNTYEKAAVYNWIYDHGTSPITRAPTTVQDLYPNQAIQDLLEYEKNKSEEDMHPAIKAFKEQSPPPIPEPREPPNTAANAAATTSGQQQLVLTPEEERRLRRQLQVMTIIGFVMSILFVLTAIYYGTPFIFVFIGLFIIWTGRRNMPRPT